MRTLTPRVELVTSFKLSGLTLNLVAASWLVIFPFILNRLLIRVCRFPCSIVRAEKTQKMIKPAAKSRKDLYMLGGGILSALQRQTKDEAEVEVLRVAY